MYIQVHNSIPKKYFARPRSLMETCGVRRPLFLTLKQKLTRRWARKVCLFFHVSCVNVLVPTTCLMKVLKEFGLWFIRWVTLFGHNRSATSFMPGCRNKYPRQVHDFRFFLYDPAAIQFLSYDEIPLAPDAACAGLKIRVVDLYIGWYPCSYGSGCSTL
ncbi:PDZ domain-containing protein [Artemisia annua]|uniref:PDZ domain-containing protein n=1 Tax=Artemisia annua TaxID=35608 RepID=A0A2U1Q1P4_ARTAN|nr:PDZ domain-containing protein [Artemisia annua]